MEWKKHAQMYLWSISPNASVPKTERAHLWVGFAFESNYISPSSTDIDPCLLLNGIMVTAIWEL